MTFCTARKVGMSTYLIVNSNDGNDTFAVKAKDIDEAAHEALYQLGWFVSVCHEEPKIEGNNDDK